MKVLFINGRPDALKNPGGDNVQMDNTRASLEALGVNVEVRGLDQLDQLPPVDIAHIFNIQMPDSSWLAWQAVHKAGIPMVLSSIYWDMYEYWFDRALAERKRWRRLLPMLGREQLKHTYINWQHLKSVRDHVWSVQRKLLQQAVRVLPNSASEARMLQRSFILADRFYHKVDVVPNGINLALYQQRPQVSQSFLERYGVRDFILQVGTISPIKNQLGLLEAVFDLPLPVVIIGHAMSEYAGYYDLCQALAQRRGNVIFIDHLQHADLPGIYALAAVHALPSWRETPGLASLEAAAAGCRVVTTRIGSTRDYFGDQAQYCYPGDTKTIRIAVERALLQPRTDALRERVLRDFTWPQAAAASLAAYEKAVHSQHEQRIRLFHRERHDHPVA